MEWSIHEVVEATGITSRTLRYYDQIGLLPPSRTGHGGLRHYDQPSLIRLQRILLLRDFGMPLADIAEVLNRKASDIEALQDHRQRLLAERRRIETQVHSVEATIAALENGETIMPQNMFEDLTTPNTTPRCASAGATKPRIVRMCGGRGLELKASNHFSNKSKRSMMHGTGS